jgi:hypothetical protein
MREPVDTDVPIERPDLFGHLLQTHLNDLGYSVRELSTLIFIRDENYFRANYLAPRGLRLVGYFLWRATSQYWEASYKRQISCQGLRSDPAALPSLPASHKWVMPVAF